MFINLKIQEYHQVKPNKSQYIASLQKSLIKLVALLHRN